MATKLETRIAEFAEQARALLAAEQVTAGPLAGLRRQGREAFARTSLPGPKTESWKYTRVGPLLEQGFLDQPVSDPTAAEIAVIEGLDALRITIVDGQPRALPATLPEGLQVVPFSQAQGAQAQALEQYLGQLADVDTRPFVALNGALASDGVLVHVTAGTTGLPPVELVIAQSEAAAPHGAHPRVLVLVESGAELMLLERHLGSAAVLTNLVMEVQVAASARLSHMRLQLAAGEARSLSALDVHVQRDGHYALHQVQTGARLRRNEIRLQALESGAEIQVGGASLTRGRQHLDNQMCIDHVAPHCSSNQVFRALAGDQSRTILNGRIHIYPKAQHTAAELNTGNLLLSAEAEIDAKPELEIYADDVTCAHGATIGQLDETALFYLRSRGLSEVAARTRLSFAFLTAVVDAFPAPSVQAFVRPELEAAFRRPAGEEVT